MGYNIAKVADDLYLRSASLSSTWGFNIASADDLYLAWDFASFLMGLNHGGTTGFRNRQNHTTRASLPSFLQLRLDFFLGIVFENFPRFRRRTCVFGRRASTRIEVQGYNL